MSATQSPLLEISGLTVTAQGPDGSALPILRDVAIKVPRGKVVALIGESGSGKTTLSLAAMGYFKSGCQWQGGTIRFNGQALDAMAPAALAALRGASISYVAQSAAAAFNSTMRIDRQVTEVPRTRQNVAPMAAKAAAEALYREMELPDPARIGARFPHQLSGGQLQRVMAAMAMISGPELLILDEPTTALDVTTQIEVIGAFKRMIAARDMAALYVSHDLALVAQIADHIVVMKDGAVVEQGPVAQILNAPRAAYTRDLLAAAHVMPAAIAPPRTPAAAPVLELEQVSAGYGRNPVVMAVKDVSFRLGAGEVLGLIGESGSGKTTLGRIIAGLMDSRSGTITLNGSALPAHFTARSPEALRAVQFAYQSADIALNPRHSIRKILARPLQLYFGLKGAALDAEIARLMARVDLPLALLDRQPAALSGGQKQRVNLARALAAKPKVIICDEITSALDTIVAANILTLIEDLRRELGMAFIFITHDLSIVARIADQVVVMQRGAVVEQGPTAAVLGDPRHDYTRLLRDSVPEMRPDWLDERRAARA